MGEEAAGDYDLEDMGAGDEDERVMEWETGLPGSYELIPLSQPLVPPGLAAAFRIPPEPGRTLLDVHRASAETVSRLRRAPSSSSNEVDSSSPAANNGGNSSSSKRARLAWTPQLHRRFVEVVAHLGIKSAVPKTIMQLMNVEGLTRENVASHLQKYRLYVKRMQGLSNEGPSASDHIFASAPVPHHGDPQVPAAAPMYHNHVVPMGVPMNSGHHHQYHQHSGYGHGHGHGSFPQQHGSK